MTWKGCFLTAGEMQCFAASLPPSSRDEHMAISPLFLINLEEAPRGNHTGSWLLREGGSVPPPGSLSRIVLFLPLPSPRSRKKKRGTEPLTFPPCRNPRCGGETLTGTRTMTAHRGAAARQRAGVDPAPFMDSSSSQRVKPDSQCPWGQPEARGSSSSPG